jgi:hypothetical protein
MFIASSVCFGFTTSIREDSGMTRPLAGNANPLLASQFNMSYCVELHGAAEAEQQATEVTQEAH